MSFNRRKEYKKFMAKQAQQAEEYRKAGMTEEQIKAMFEFDKEQFLSDMRFYTHNQSLNVCLEGLDEEAFNPLLKKYLDNMVVYQEDTSDWLEQLEDDDLRDAIKGLSENNQTIIRLLFEEYSIVEIAEIFNEPVSTIGSRIKRIRLVLYPYMSAIFPEVLFSKEVDA